MNKRMNRRRGFSLVEIMVVVVIIGLLAGVVGVGVVQFLADARMKTAQAQIKDFETALELYKMEKGKYPSNSQGLEALTKDRKSGEPYMKTIPKDPWGNEYEYKKLKKKFEIVSFGADGEEEGEGEDKDIKYSELGQDN